MGDDGGGGGFSDSGGGFSDSGGGFSDSGGGFSGGGGGGFSDSGGGFSESCTAGGGFSDNGGGGFSDNCRRDDEGDKGYSDSRSRDDNDIRDSSGGGFYNGYEDNNRDTLGDTSGFNSRTTENMILSDIGANSNRKRRGEREENPCRYLLAIIFFFVFAVCIVIFALYLSVKP